MTLIDRLFRAASSDLSEPAELVVHDAASWEGTWERLTAATVPAPDRPVVDFSRDVVLVVAAGERPSGGWRVTVDAVRPAADGGLDVTYTVAGPAPECFTTQVITAPVDVVRVPRPAGTVRFAARTLLEPC